MSSIYIANNRILAKIYKGYQPFPRSWEMDKDKATLTFGPNKIELTFEVWTKIFKEIMISEGICSEKQSSSLDIREFEIEEDREGIRVKYLFSPREII